DRGAPAGDPPGRGGCGAGAGGSRGRAGGRRPARGRRAAAAPPGAARDRCRRAGRPGRRAAADRRLRARPDRGRPRPSPGAVHRGRRRAARRGGGAPPPPPALSSGGRSQAPRYTRLSMSDPQLMQRIEAALGTVMEPELHRDLMSLDMVRDLRVDDAGTVSMRVVLTTPACPLKDRIQRDIEQALIPINGVERVEVRWDSNVTTTRGLPGRKDIPGVRNIVAVSAGKGGVGKTTVSVNVAIALQQAGARVGLLDADIAGPNVTIMLGPHDQPGSMGERILALEAHGLRVMSLGTILKLDQAVVWRGPMIGGAIRQFLYDVEWGDLDYLVIDLPPGTGDAQLTLAQSIP